MIRGAGIFELKNAGRKAYVMLYIRTDMNHTIATGHVMRCLAIADAAKSIGEEVTFLLADRQAEEIVQDHGHSVIILNTKWDEMDSELPVLRKLIESRHIKRILIDSYQVTAHYLSQLTAMTETAYIDDINAFDYPVNTLICYAGYWQKFDYLKRYPNTALCLGPQYAPLRKVFSDCPPKYIRPAAENLLLMSGGSDPCSLLSGLLESLDKKAYKRIDVICGLYDTKYKELQIKFAPFQSVRIHRSVNNIEHYMNKADVAVSAGGTTLYELCACGTPAISYAIADNQLDNVKFFRDQNIMDYAGDVRENPGRVIHNLIRSIHLYRENPSLRRKKSQSMQRLVDGKGAERIASL